MPQDAYKLPFLEDRGDNGRVQSVFATPEEYAEVMEAPGRVMLIEWRRIKRPGHASFISHSLLQVEVQDGRRYRYEKTSDLGLVVSNFSPGEIIFDSAAVYNNRSAKSHQLVRPMLLEDLQQVAEAVAGQPYSLRRSNCHHFVRDMWNAIVIPALQCWHYPDRTKSGFLRGASAPLSACGLDLVAVSASVSLSRSFSGSQSRLQPEPRLGLDTACDGVDRVRIVISRSSETGVLSGEFSALAGDAVAYGQAHRKASFVKALAAQQVLRLQRASDPAPFPSPPADEKDPCGSWLADQLPCGAREAGSRLAERISQVDIHELMSQVAAIMNSPSWQQGSCYYDGEHEPRQSSRRGSIRDFMSSVLPREEDPILDVLWALLESDEELRIVSYARLRPLSKEKKELRLRMLSGDALKGDEHMYSFSIRDVSGSPSAVELMEQELEALQIAHGTADWAFLTLL